jgi:hypothetical protein
MNKNSISSQLHSLSMYPLILIFSSILKGKKIDFTNFFLENEKENLKNLELLNIHCSNYSFFDKIKLFFDKKTPLFDKTYVTFDLDLSISPEFKKFYLFDFSRMLNVFYSMSMLSSRITNDNLFVKFNFHKRELTSNEINNFLRYCFLAFASKKIDRLYFNKNILKSEKATLAYETMLLYLNNSTLINFSNAKDLYVLTCRKDKKTFDLIWSSKDRKIELTDFKKVYDKFGNLMTKDIIISVNPIYAFH